MEGEKQNKKCRKKKLDKEKFGNQKMKRVILMFYAPNYVILLRWQDLVRLLRVIEAYSEHNARNLFLFSKKIDGTKDILTENSYSK